MELPYQVSLKLVQKWTTLVEIHVRPDAEYDFQLVDFHETQAYSSACCKELLYQI